MTGNPKSHEGIIDGQRLGFVQQIAVDNVIISAHNEGDISILGLIQSQTELGRASPTGIKNNANRGNRAALKIGGKALLGR